MKNHILCQDPPPILTNINLLYADNLEAKNCQIDAFNCFLFTKILLLVHERHTHSTDGNLRKIVSETEFVDTMYRSTFYL